MCSFTNLYIHLFTKQALSAFHIPRAVLALCEDEEDKVFPLGHSRQVSEQVTKQVRLH